MNTHIEHIPNPIQKAVERAALGPVLKKSTNMTEERTKMIQDWVSAKAKLGWSPKKIARESFRIFKIRLTFS